MELLPLPLEGREKLRVRKRGVKRKFLEKKSRSSRPMVLGGPLHITNLER